MGLILDNHRLCAFTHVQHAGPGHFLYDHIENEERRCKSQPLHRSRLWCGRCGLCSIRYRKQDGYR